MQSVIVTTDKKELLASIYKPISGMLDLMWTLDNKRINTVPYENSWTAGMLFRHVSKSLNAMSEVMLMDGRPAGRDEGEKIPELKKTFLDFSIKMKSPEFIVPEEGPYEKQAICDEVNNAFGHLKQSTAHAELPDLVESVPLGAMTRLEILYFVSYHMQRHLHQMKLICESLKYM